MTTQQKTDFLIIGSGIAGLSYAYKVADYFYQKNERVSITIVTKADEEESNTKYAQGGIAAVIDPKDTFEKHIEDTLVAGAGLCNKKIVEIVVKEGPERIMELIAWGTQFDTKESGELSLAKEGGHSGHRILHHKDVTGKEIERALIEKVKNHPYITILNHHFAIDLITQHHLGEKVTRKRKDIKCFGAYILNTKDNTIFTLQSKVTLLATGGIGQAYKTTTNPTIATGDGIAMAYRAKAIIENMEFVQFHPTALYHPGESPAFLITEAIRGAGAVLRTKKGDAFMHKYDDRKDLAPRDIVARAIDFELKKSGDEYVFLDATGIDKEEITGHFPNIYNKCLSIGIDITRDFIPVVPAAHYLCGGVKVNEWGQTNIQYLYAVGECAYTGLHGANRLASNSLLEAVVFAHRASNQAIKDWSTSCFMKGIPDWNDEGTIIPNENILVTSTKKEIQQILSEYVGIVRSPQRLERALTRLKLIYQESESLYEKSKLSQPICEVRNLRSIAYLTASQALKRKESVGLHYILS
ncbi:MAG: L-aspartate oxidase [Vicingaceae bacterium]